MSKAGKCLTWLYWCVTPSNTTTSSKRETILYLSIIKDIWNNTTTKVQAWTSALVLSLPLKKATSSCSPRPWEMMWLPPWHSPPHNLPCTIQLLSLSVDPTAYAKMLWVAQGLWSWNGFMLFCRHCSLQNHVKAHNLFSHNFQRLRRSCESTAPHDFQRVCRLHENTLHSHGLCSFLKSYKNGTCFCEYLLGFAKFWCVTQNVMLCHFWHMYNI